MKQTSVERVDARNPTVTAMAVRVKADDGG
jgi:hypothetical protein